MVEMMTLASADRMEAAVENNNAFVVLSTLMFDTDGIPYRIAWSYNPKNDGVWTVARSIASNEAASDGLNWIAETDDVQIIDSFQNDIFEFLEGSEKEIIDAQALVGLRPTHLCTVVEFTEAGHTDFEELETLIEPQEPSEEELAEIFKA